jgi:hypothetical protein
MTTEPDETPEEFRKRVGASHPHAIRLFREAREVAQRTNRHEDTMIVWTVSLAAGAILLTFQAPERYTAGLQGWRFALVLSPWVASVALGVVARFLIARFLRINERRGYDTAAKMVMLPFTSPRLTVESYSKTMSQVLSGKDEKLERLGRIAGHLATASAYAFLLGVIVVSLVFSLTSAGKSA